MVLRKVRDSGVEVGSVEEEEIVGRMMKRFDLDIYYKVGRLVKDGKFKLLGRSSFVFSCHLRIENHRLTPEIGFEIWCLAN